MMASQMERPGNYSSDRKWCLPAAIVGRKTQALSQQSPHCDRTGSWGAIGAAHGGAAQSAEKLRTRVLAGQEALARLHRGSALETPDVALVA